MQISKQSLVHSSLTLDGAHHSGCMNPCHVLKHLNTFSLAGGLEL